MNTRHLIGMVPAFALAAVVLAYAPSSSAQSGGYGMMGGYDGHHHGYGMMGGYGHGGGYHGPGMMGGYGAGYGDARQRCAARFKSFEWDTGLYTTYGGVKRLCPYLN